MTNTKKMTKKDYFNQLKTNYPLTKDEIDFINHEIELLDKKNSAERKPTPTQKANETIKDAILAFMKPNHLYTITDFIKGVPDCAELTNQKVSAIVRQMIGKNVERVEEKRKAYFKLIKIEG